MNNTVYAFLLSSIAGLSTLIGTIPIFIKKVDKNKIISNSLFFASGVMITISITDLIPESYKLLASKFYKFPSIIILLIFLIIGIILSSFIGSFVSKKDKLYRVGVISMLAIILHNIPEGIATFLSSNTSLGVSLVLAISAHNIPEGISISVPIYYSTNSKFKAFFYTFISAISEPIGAVIAYLFLSKYSDNIMCYLFAIIAGIMIQISIFELLKEAIHYKNKHGKVYFIIGSLFMILNHLLLK